jgi:hypothetical protein
MHLPTRDLSFVSASIILLTVFHSASNVYGLGLGLGLGLVLTVFHSASNV